MAMEIMANSNYVDSALYLLMLLEEYGHRIADCNTKNHVNFKSMVSYFGLRVRDVDCLDPDDVSKKLVSLNLLTTEWLNILLESRLDWFITNIARSSTFNVASIVPKPEVEAVIESQYRAEISFDDKDPVLDFTIGLEDAPKILIEDEVAPEILEEHPDLSDQDDLSTPPVEEPIFIEEDNKATEVTLETELLLNNHQIKQTDDSNGVDWF